MVSVVQKWLTRRLGLDLDCSATSFAEVAKNGKLFADLLLSYNIITKEQHAVIKGGDSQETALDNFVYHIVAWLRSINVTCSDSEVDDIVSARGSTAINLFYKIYLELEDKNRLHFEVMQRTSHKLRPDKTRFTVTSVRDEINEYYRTPENPHFDYITEGWDVIQWYKDKFLQMNRTLKNIKQAYQENKKHQHDDDLDGKYVRTMEYSEDVTISQDNIDILSDVDTITYSELLGEQEAAKKMNVTCQQNLKDAKNMVNDIKLKHKKDLESRLQKELLQKDLIFELWNDIQAKQEDAFRTYIGDKILKQSIYEKQMVRKLLETRYHRKLMADNRLRVDLQVEKQRERDLEREVFFQEKQRLDQSSNYYCELERLNELHRRLYQEEVKLKRKKNEDMCQDVVLAFIDYSVRYSEYSKTYGIIPSKSVTNVWKELFFKEQSIMPIVRPVEDIIQYDVEMPEEIGIMFQTEIERQGIIDERDFGDYFHLKPPWVLDNISYSEEDLRKIERGTNILGFIAHRLLLSKYPLPPSAQKIDHPKIEIAVCIDGIHDATILPVLQKLLMNKQVKVIEIQDAINFCLEAFKSEMKPDDFEELPLNQEQSPDTAIPKQADIQPGKKHAKKKSKMTRKSLSVGIADDQAGDMTERKNDKTIQTPNWMPGESIILSNRADLGKTAYEELNQGNQLTTYLVAAMFIEYLLHLTEIKGFVLVNFPTNCEEAALLEEMLTGVKVPGICSDLNYVKSIMDFIDLEKRKTSETIDTREYRKSKLLANPVIEEEPPIYKTYLTAYIKVRQVPLEVEAGSPELPPIVEQYSENLECVCKFYSDQGCYYNMYYKTFDFATIKHLAKLVIGDFSLPMKSSVELFGDDVEDVEGNYDAYKTHKKPSSGQQIKATGKKAKTKVTVVKNESKLKQEKKGKDGKKGEKGAKKTSSGKSNETLSKGKKSAKNKNKETQKVADVPKTFEEKEVQVPEAEEEEEIVFIEAKDFEPGESGWAYVNIPIPEALETALATYWEAIERVYYSDFKEVFFLKRTALNAFVPFTTHIKQIIHSSLQRPDDKQNYLTEFQILFNSIDDDLREDEETKAELHCRIAEFGEKLNEIADKNMMDTELYRKNIINDSWVPYQICDLLNAYIIACQLEINRCVETLQLLSDYYTAMSTGSASDELKLQRIQLHRINNSDEEAISNMSSNINKFFITFEEVDTNIYDMYMSAVLAQIHNCLEECKSSCYKIIKKIEDKFQSKKASKKLKSYRSANALWEEEENENAARKNMSHLISEWKTAVEGELARIRLRLSLLQKNGSEIYQEYINMAKDMYQSVHDQIEDKYHNEIYSIATACELLARATELEVPIEPELVLDVDKFSVRHEILLHEKLPSLSPDPLPCRQSSEDVFTIQQLSCIVDILKQLAPSGLMSERAFVYLLQDLKVNTYEDNRPELMPKLWHKMRPGDLNVLSTYLFGRSEYIQWKDFILCNLPIMFPTEKELMELRKHCREFDPDATELIKDYQFSTIETWFDNGLDKSLLLQIKTLIFKMYAIDEDTLNYTCLLLDFCKDVDPLLGFAKALELSLGRYICYDREMGDEYVSALYSQRLAQTEYARRKKIDRKLDKMVIKEIVKTMVDNVVHQCESLVIEDWYDSNEASMRKNYMDDSLRVEFIDISKLDILSEQSSQPVLPEETNAPIEIEENKMDCRMKTTDISDGDIVVYTLRIEHVICVVTAALPWHARIENINDQSFRQIIEAIFEECRNKDFNAVFAYQFLNNKRLKDLLNATTKFTVVNPAKLVYKVLGKI